MEGLTPGGDNIPVEAGQYRVYFNLNDWNKPTARLDASMYGQPEEGDTPEPGPGPEPVEVKGWNIIGLNGDWDNDVLASEKDNGPPTLRLPMPPTSSGARTVAGTRTTVV
jgi:hypothetical protein